MPEVIPPDGPSEFKAWMRRIEQRLDKIETARRLPNASMRGGSLNILADNGGVRARLGVQDDTRVAQTFYDTSGNELIRLGEQSDGRFGQDVISPTGTRVLRLGQLPDGKVGLAVYDADGNEQVRFGQLAGGGYGGEVNLEVDVDNAYIVRNVTDWGDGTSVISGTGSVSGPSVSLPTGSRALVFLSARIQANDGVGAEVSYAISGATSSAANADLGRFAGLSFASAANGFVEASVGRIYLQTALTPGVNEFTMKYRTNGSTAVAISHRTIAVLPL